MSGLVTVAYIGATILFILALGGLSNPETARRGNLYGIIGMSIALLATVFGVVTAHYLLLLGGLVIGGSIGLILARRVQMLSLIHIYAPTTPRGMACAGGGGAGVGGGGGV